MRRPSRSARFYRALLWLLPGDVRRRFGGDMTDVFRLRCSEARGSITATLLVWARAVVDIVGQAISMRLGGAAVRPTLQDMRYGARAIVATPGLAFVAVITLALGIAASTATFSVVHAVLLKKLPVSDPERLVVVWPEANANHAMVRLAEERMPALERVSGLSSWTLTLTGLGEPREITAMRVTPGYFELLGVDPLLGRGFTPDEALPGAGAVVVLSHPFWVSAFGSDPDVIGRTIDLGGAGFDRRTVIGVMPPGVETLWQRADGWITIESDPAVGLSEDPSWYVNVRLARLAPGATLAQANEQVRPYALEVQRELPENMRPDVVTSASVRPLRSFLTREVGRAVWVALGAASMVLLIGCFNVANLLMARGDARAQDLAVRAALGAGRARMTRMLLSEAALLGLGGGVLGVLSAHGLLRVIVAQAPSDLPGLVDVRLDAVVLTYAVGATLFSTLTAGLVPALRVGRTRALAALGGGTRGAAGRGGGRLTSALVGGQVALAVVVTVGSGLMVRSLATMLAVDPGMTGEGVLAVKASPPAGRYPDGQAFLSYYDDIGARIAALPQVESVGGIHLLPGSRGNWSFPTHIEGYSAPPGQPTPSVNFRAVRGDYFATTRVPVSSGRPLTAADHAEAAPAVVVNQAFVTRFWPDEAPLGKTLSLFSATATRYTVVGVVGDVHQHGRDVAPLPEMYFAHTQVPWNQMSVWIVARVSTADPLALIPAVREAIWSVDPEVPIADFVHLADALGESTRQTRFVTLLLGVFGSLALLLCAVGVFGVTAYTSGRRRPEFGVRLALGSSRTRVVRSAVMRSLAPVAVGMLVGLIASGLGARVLESVLYEVEPTDPLTFAVVTTVLAVTALFASVVPAWRASRVDPVTVLGSD